MSEFVRRDYSIVGPEKEKAIAKGLANARWYQCPIPRKRLKELMVRRDGPPLLNTILWFAALGASGWLAYLSWNTWWAIPAFLFYGTIYAVGATARWHEFSHGTPFRTSWANEAMYQLCAFLILNQATHFRWSHVRHHTDTYIVGRDLEIMEPRPPMMKRLVRHVLKIQDIYGAFKALFLRAFGKLSKEDREIIPESEFRKVRWEARAYLIGYGAVIAACIAMKSIMPLMFIGLPAFYGGLLMTLLNSTQHLGLYEDTPDHRLCCRTFYTNPFLRFLYCNMNYHMEHHMFPMVPFYNLPALHEEIKHDCPAPAPSFTAALKETISALLQEFKDPTYIVPKYREFAEKVRARANAPAAGQNPPLALSE